MVPALEQNYIMAKFFLFRRDQRRTRNRFNETLITVKTCFTNCRNPIGAFLCCFLNDLMEKFHWRMCPLIPKTDTNAKQK